MNQPVAVPEVLSADLPAGVFLLDVREDDEWTAGHAPTRYTCGSVSSARGWTSCPGTASCL